MREDTKKDIILLLSFLLVVGLAYIFFAQPIFSSVNNNYSLLNLFDDLFDYELIEIEELIMKFDKRFMYGLLNMFVLPFSALSLLFMLITKFKPAFRVIMLFMAVLTLILSGVAFYMGYTLTQTGDIVLTNFSYIYFALGLLVTVASVLFVKI